MKKKIQVIYIFFYFYIYIKIKNIWFDLSAYISVFKIHIFLHFCYEMLESQSLCLPEKFWLSAFFNQVWRKTSNLRFNHKIKPEQLVVESIKLDLSEARFNYFVISYFTNSFS